MSDARDRYREFFTAKLWHWLPAIQRELDAAVPDGGEGQPQYVDSWVPGTPVDPVPGPLYAFVRALATQAALLKRDQDRLWSDQYVELADDWAVPYIADLVATRLVSSLNLRGRRVDVAKTIYYRRRKGTLAVLEQLVADITGWDGTVVEEFRRLGRMRHGLDPHPRPGRVTGTPEGGWADLRRPRGALLVGSPFDEFHHTPDLRSPRRRGDRDGRYGIRKLGVHLYRLQAVEVEGVTPRRFQAIAPGVDAFTFDPSGRDVPLFATNAPRSDWDAWHPAREWELPAAISCRLLNDVRFNIGEREVAALRVHPALTPAQRTAAADDLARLLGQVFADEAMLRLVLASRPQGALLTLPAVLQDLVRGSLEAACGKAALLTGRADRPGDGAVTVTLDTGVPPLLPVLRDRIDGATLATWPVAWPAGRRPLWIDPALGRFVLDRRGTPGATVSVRCFVGMAGRVGAGGHARDIELPTAPFTPWAAGSPAGGVRADGVTFVGDSATYLNPPDGAGLVAARVLAADGARPYVELAGEWRFTAGAANATLEIDGLWIGSRVAASVVLAGDFEEVVIRHCTLDPGGTDAAGAALPPVPLVVRGRVEHLRVLHSVTGPIRVTPAGQVDELVIEDSIVQAIAPGATAIATGGASVRILRTSVLAARPADLVIDVEQLDASELLSTGRIDVTNTQAGCFRFSTRTSGSRVPHPYRSHVIDDTAGLFVSRRFGDPGFAQLAESAPPAIAEGAESGAEIGAFSSGIESIKRAGLRAKLDEYMPFGLLPVFLAEN